MEYCSGGNLKDHIKQKLIISFKNAISIMVDIINGLQHIHSRGYAHNNIKL